MAFTLNGPAEAYAAVSLLVVGADGLGTMEERRFLFDELGSMDAFAGHDAESFGALLGALMGRMFTDLSDDGVSLNADAADQLCAGACDVLDTNQRGELFAAAVNLACADGLAEEERTVLMGLAKGLGLGEATAAGVIGDAAG
ncbi:MAG: hypothetical protein PVJ02_04020 [Gemmatimonadota bacterium]|jgi:tellurite resistance protein